MPSHALDRWRQGRSAKLDEIEQAHAALGGTSPGRRFATEQINHAYAVLLCSQFQAFCRDLHSECAAHFAGTAAMLPQIRSVLLTEFAFGRKLDLGSPNPGNIGADFGRFLGDKFWTIAATYDARLDRRKNRLQALCDWRNAIAHQDFSKVGAGSLHLGLVRDWRRACNGLATTFDAAMAGELTNLTGVAPW